MTSCKYIVASLLLSTSAFAAPQLTMTPHVPMSVATRTAHYVGDPTADQRLELAVSLPLRDEAGLRAFLHDIYDHNSPNFRHYLSVAAFADRYGAAVADYAALIKFANDHHLTVRQTYANRRLVDIGGTVADIEKAFNINIHLYKHDNDDRVFFAPDREPSLDLATPVLHVTGLDNEFLPYNHLIRGDMAHAKPHSTGSGPDGEFIGSDIREAYYGGKTLTGAGQSVGLLELAGYDMTDVTTYFAQVKQPLNVPVVGESFNGASLKCLIADNCDDSEQVLDIEEAISMAPGLDKLVVYVGHQALSVLNGMASDNTSKQLSSSWGWKPSAATDTPVFEEFAAQGQSFVDATGDDGYHLARDAVWPADDQYVTAVGGTSLVTYGAGGAWKREIGWAHSGGGPSPAPEKIAIPGYQVPFITQVNGGSKRFRNVPDIAGDADTDNYSCYDGKCWGGNGGTSYAAPLWAGFIALANQQAAAQGKPTLGFLNETIYQIGASSDYATIFHDETVGNNGRYNSEVGYDLVTGFGSPNGVDFIKALITGG